MVVEQKEKRKRSHFLGLRLHFPNFHGGGVTFSTAFQAIVSCNLKILPQVLLKSIENYV